MAKTKKELRKHEASRLLAFMGILKVLNERGVHYGALSDYQMERIADYVFAVVRLWDEVRDTKGYKYLKTLDGVAEEWFTTDYAQVMGRGTQMVVLKAIPWANTKKVTIVYE